MAKAILAHRSTRPKSFGTVVDLCSMFSWVRNIIATTCEAHRTLSNYDDRSVRWQALSTCFLSRFDGSRAHGQALSPYKSVTLFRKFFGA